VRLLGDENLSRRLIEALRLAGHDVLWCGEGLQATPDVRILIEAYRQRRIVLTQDKDFANLVFGAGRPCRGIVLVRMPEVGELLRNKRILDLLSIPEDQLLHAMTVISANGIRRRPLIPR